MGRNLRNVSLWVAIFLAFILVFKMMTQTGRVEKKDIITVLKLGNAGKILSPVVDRGQLLTGRIIAHLCEESMKMG